jgi:hypothetical protein
MIRPTNNLDSLLRIDFGWSAKKKEMLKMN